MTDWPGQEEVKPQAWPGQAEQQEGPQAPLSGPDGWSQAAKPLVNSTPTGGIMKAFGQGFGEAWGPERLGLSDDSMKWLADKGIFAKGNKFENPFQAFNEGIILPAAAGLDAAIRTVNATYRGAQEAGVEAGLPKDVVSLPDAFMGSPGGLGHIEMRPGLPKDVVQAKELGVIGETPKPITEGPPAEAAQRTVTMPAEGPRGEKVSQEVAGQPNEWRQRFDQFVGKMNTPGDMQQLIKDAADQNQEFPAARAGEISLKAREDLASAAGVEHSAVDWDGVGRKLQNDNQVRNAMQAMLTATEDVRNAAREVKAGGGEDSLMKLQEAMLRRDQWVEQVVGHRAEWGRTGNVFQEFLQRSKEEQGFTNWLKDQDRSKDGLRKIANAVDQLDRGQAAQFLSDMNKPTAWDKFKFYWVNSLISGPVTHAKYAIANTAFAGYEAAVTGVAGGIGTVRRAVTGGNEGVYAGEAAARLYGIVAGVPDAMKAAVQAAKTGLQTPLPGELAQNILPKNNKNITFQQRPIPGNLGAVIGLPSRGASAIHSFFNFMGYRASIEAQAYRQAAKEGLSPISGDGFWNRQANVSAAPTTDMMNAAIEDGYRLTFINELSPGMKSVQTAVNQIKPFQLIMPFLHIPFNILSRAVEGTPAAFLSKETREALAGKQGAVKQDMAAARLITGGAVGAWAVNMVLNDRMTGFGPTDQKERAQWIATGHQPYSVRIGDEWISFNRFGPMGTMLGLYSNLAEAIPHMKPDSEELTKGIALTVHSTGRLLEDEVGMQGLAGLMDAINEPERKGTRFISGFAGSLLPFSSALRQTASAMDPEMREAKTVVDGLRYNIPVARMGLNPKRDWLGSPIANAGYGGDLTIPGASALIQHRAVASDPVAQEMTRLDLHPAPPEQRISGVKLPARIYDRYQATAGPYLHEILSSYVSQPGWHDMPIFVRQEMFRNAIKMSRQQAGAAMQMEFPELIQQGVEDRAAKIEGRKPGKLQ